jgi:hypothetical protein
MSALVNFINETSSENLKKVLGDRCIDVKEYKKMFMTSFNETANYEDPIVRQANGVIFEKDTKKLLHYSFEKCYEGFGNGKGDSYKNIKDISEFSVSLYFEGSVIKLFYHLDEWKISTSRVMDANHNYWVSEKSFKVLFEECVLNTCNLEYSEFLDTLDKNHFYTFLIQHPENTLNNSGVPVVFFLNEVDRETLKETIPDENHLTLIQKTNDLSSLENFIETRDHSQNYMVFVYNSDGSVKSRIKLLCNTLKRKVELAGQFPDIGLGYLRYASSDAIERHEYYDLYPEFTEKFAMLDALFTQTYREIHSAYIKKFVKKEEHECPERYSRTLSQLHGQYKKTREIIRYNDVINKLRNLNHWTLASVLEYKY